MADPFIGELRLMAFGFAPRNWIECNGQIMPIQQWQALYSLVGNFYGGDGVRTFGIPNLQGRAPLGFDNQYPIGSQPGEAAHTLLATEVPPHNHSFNAVMNAATTNSPSGGFFASVDPFSLKAYASAENLVSMNDAMLSSAGGNQAHPNQQPYLVMNWCISMTGIFPRRP